MYRLILSLVVVLGMVACSGDKENSGATEKSVPAPTASTERPAEGTGQPAIPEPVSETAGMKLSLYGDEAGTVTELAVTPGEQFTVYLLAEIEGTERIAGIQYSLEIPEGVSIFAEHKMEPRSLSMGDVQQNFNIAFQCKDPGMIGIMSYTCVAADDFTGGTIRVAEGITADGHGFCGFATCPDDGQPLKYPATRGSITLTRK